MYGGERSGRAGLGKEVSRLVWAWLIGVLLALPTWGQEHSPEAQPRESDVDDPLSRQFVFKTGLGLPPVGVGGRSLLRLDPVELAVITGKFAPPKSGDTVTRAGGGSAAWQEITAAEDGTFTGRATQGGYVFFTVKSRKRRVMLLQARGHTLVYINGWPRVGDPYSHGFVKLPVELVAGDNHFLFHCQRGKLNARLTSELSEQAYLLTDADVTVPTLLPGPAGRPADLSLLVVNPANEPVENLTGQTRSRTFQVTISSYNGEVLGSMTLPRIPPMTLAKVPMSIGTPALADYDRELPLTVSLQITEWGPNKHVSSSSVDRITLRVTRPEQTRRVTFVSRIDGSVQFYAVKPADRVDRAGLVLSLHGAGVDASRQVDAYGVKPDLHIVAPTNRRPFGYDWEDWGRLDALEVLDHAQRTLKSDPARTYLTGHSMGGHGAWHLSVTHPDRFAAVGSSAGWVSFDSYGGRPPLPNDTFGLLLARAAGGSDTLSRLSNLAPMGVYVLHGEADDNVPVGQARLMRQKLSEFHRDWLYHEQPRAGHWWDDSDEPGAACVDWPPMFDLFARRRLPDTRAVRLVDFATVSPAVSASSHWVTIEEQREPFALSRVQLRCDPWRRRFIGTTNNVRRLSLSIAHLGIIPGETVTVDLDGTRLEGIRPVRPDVANPTGISHPEVHLLRGDAGWLVADRPSPLHKHPGRSGPFKAAFDNRMVFVYGTRGSPEETAVNLARARFDAQAWWYLANGYVDVVADTDVEKEPKRYVERNLILYGNANSHGLWEKMLPDCPLLVERGRVRLGEATWTGEDLAVLMVRPRPDSHHASIGVIAGSGLVGLRLSERMNYFASGVGVPDFIVVSSDMLTHGDRGLKAVGFFGSDWSLTNAVFARNP